MTAAKFDPDSPEKLIAILDELTRALTGDDPSKRHVVVSSSTLDPAGRSKAEARYRALVEQIPAVTFTVSLEEGAPEIYVGPQIEQLLGFSQDEWMEDPILWFNQCHPDDRDIWHQEFARGIQTGGPFRADCRVFAKDGHVVWLHGEARLVRDDRGRPLFLQGIAFDISEAKAAEQKMREAQEIKVLNERLNAVGQMAASIGHDLRNPLGAIKNAWFYIQKKIGDGADLQADKRIADFSKIIDRELGHCASILSELLEFSRDRQPHRSPCPLGPLVREALSVAVKPAPTMELIDEVPDDLPVPNLDSDQIRQVLVNLVQNALEAIPKDGWVRVRGVLMDDRGVRIEVTDNGKGIPPEIKDSVWRPLFTTKRKGTGLGLPIVANVVQRHGGLVSFESAPGRGTTFRVDLPAAEASTGPLPDEGGAAERGLF